MPHPGTKTPAHAHAYLRTPSISPIPAHIRAYTCTTMHTQVAYCGLIPHRPAACKSKPAARAGQKTPARGPCGPRKNQPDTALLVIKDLIKLWETVINCRKPLKTKGNQEKQC